MEYLALDLGSTNTKAYLLEDGRVVRALNADTPAPLGDGRERYEIDAEAYFGLILRLLSALRTSRTRGLLLSTQMHGYVLTNERFLPLSPYVSWRDGLGKKHLKEIETLLGRDAAAPSGVPLKGNLALCALLGRAMEGESTPVGARFCTLGGYVIGRLTGAHVCHMTNAAPSGLCDVRGGAWNEALIRRAGLEGLVFPALIDDLSPAGDWAGVAVYPDLGDQQVCALGADLRADHDIHVSLGTAGLIGCLSKVWAAGAFESRPWLMPGLYLRTVSGLPGGRHVAALEKLLRDLAQTLSGAAVLDERVWRFMTEPRAGDAPGGTLLSALCGTPEELVTEFYAGMANAFLDAANRIAKRVDRVAFSGGCAAKNPALRGYFGRVFMCEADGADYDVTAGFLRLIRLIEKS